VREEPTYRELRPRAELAAHVWTAWIHRVPPGAAPYLHRTVPNASVEISCPLGESPRIAGPSTRAAVARLAPGAVVVGARLRPGAAPAILGLPASELVDAEVDSDALWGPWAVELGERVAAAGTPAAAVAALQDGLVERLAGRPDPVVAEVVSRLMAGREEPLEALTRSLAISERQLRRRCHAAVGLAPKPLQRVLRFQGFLAVVQAELARGRAPGLARLAADAGYADQAHLTRECARLSGLAPGAFLRETRRQCGPAHDHAASFVPLLRRRSRG
jgi:AraC-like DNA-binding protein